MQISNKLNFKTLYDALSFTNNVQGNTKLVKSTSVQGLVQNSLRAFFTNFLKPSLTCKLGNPLDDWVKSTSLTNHPAGYIIRALTRALKICWIRPWMIQTNF